jgi:hypothetical protein
MVRLSGFDRVGRARVGRRERRADVVRRQSRMEAASQLFIAIVSVAQEM